LGLNENACIKINVYRKKEVVLMEEYPKMTTGFQNGKTGYSLFTTDDMDGYNFSQIEEYEEYRGMMLKVFGLNIRNSRLRRNLTQEEVGELAGINPKYLGEIERGEKNPTALVVYKLSRALKVSVSEILTDGDNPRINKKFIKEVERLFDGRRSKDIKKAIKILKVYFE
jgi:transcriptional regulator with XRE-family HTH domain